MSHRAGFAKLNRSNVRRLVRARAYTNVAHLRRYFNVQGDDVSRLTGPCGQVFLALPEGAASIIGRLWSEGKIGVELTLAVRAALVDGIYSTESACEPRDIKGASRQLAVASSVRLL